MHVLLKVNYRQRGKMSRFEQAHKTLLLAVLEKAKKL